jgi:hypothetical protein
MGRGSIVGLGEGVGSGVGVGELVAVGAGVGEGDGVGGKGMVQLWPYAFVPPNIAGWPVGPDVSAVISEMLMSLPKVERGTISQRTS